ncbi:N-carbamoyl-D-amino-acid hydrolase [Puniceibacterium sp. IMCC21224]|uniref:N-carbamoyl-D-amino-acid hydrolase n=1 Tax=Puniceibacterium sp. IMCC21224 TaxID=1618204 RepID=UPI00064DB0BB|nr:N-carbamoyl-D-amino-acid hydrolase [Puniceibacterium sp. IMCC21224]KMK68466.1 putative amidohydrolase [Puniceibacterium sp. IMCC21224]
MTRSIRTAAAQMGPIARDEPRASAVARMVALLEQAAEQGANLVVFPELALTSFFPRWYIDDPAQVDTWFERAMPNAATQPLFERARAMGIAFSFGYAELVEQDGILRHYNTAILVDATGQIVDRYHKVHLPGHAEHEAWRPFQHLEKRYFDPSPHGFAAVDALGGRLGQAICNDRRWPETYRELALDGAEMALIGYNTPRHYPPAPEHDHLQDFHNHLSLQAGAYANGMWVVGVAKAGVEEGCELIGGSAIVAPTGEIVVQAKTLEDEVIIADCDLDRCAEIRANIFDFAKHRRPEVYTRLTAQK